MTTCVFPDNTVLINFDLVSRHDIIEWFTQGQAVWTASVHSECSRSAERVGLNGMHRWSFLFGEPLRPTPAELGDSHTIAEQMRKPGDSCTFRKNLGEAETIAIIESRYRNAAIFLTDDGDARAQARGRGIPVYTTAHILALYEVKGRITHDQAREYLALMRNHHQGIGMDARDYDAFVETLVNRYAEPRCQNN